ncbi:lactadherin-like [Branchiostoma floridae x Branchiostoma belcheri]
MESCAIPDESITASSFYSGGTAPFDGRLNGVAGIGAWAANSRTIGEWLQADLGEMKRVTATIIQGRYSSPDQWVTSYKLQYGATGTSWTTYTSNNSSEKVFPGNVDRNTPVTNLLDYPIGARYVRFLPQTWHGWISMRVEILGCTLTTDKPIRAQVFGGEPIRAYNSRNRQSTVPQLFISDLYFTRRQLDSAECAPARIQSEPYAG